MKPVTTPKEFMLKELLLLNGSKQWLLMFRHEGQDVWQRADTRTFKDHGHALNALERAQKGE